MESETVGVETTGWFGDETERRGPSTAPQYALAATYSVDSNSSLAVCVVEAIVDVSEPADGQTSLSLYEYVNPDALREVITTSTTKQSDVEVRFTIEEYLVVVRSDDSIRVYEPLKTRI